MCKWGTDAIVRLAHPMPVSGRTEIPLDACLAPLVQMLNDYGVHTTGCCCGHGHVIGQVLYEQGGQQFTLEVPMPSEYDRLKAQKDAIVARQSAVPDRRPWQAIEALPADLVFFIAAWRCSGAAGGYDIGEVMRDGDGFFNLTGRLAEPPTYWMPLPGPPLAALAPPADQPEEK